MTHFNPDYTVRWYYNHRHHGKGFMDSVWETVQNMSFQHVKSNKCVINGAKDFAKYGNKIINPIKDGWGEEAKRPPYQFFPCKSRN